MSTESKKLQTSLDPVGILVVEEGENYFGRLLDACIKDARIAQELMDPTRKTAETPLEHEQREVMRRMDQLLADALEGYEGDEWSQFVHEVRAAAAPFLED